MRLILIGHDMVYEASNLCYLFFPGEKVEVSDSSADGDFALVAIKKRRGFYSALAVIRREGKISRGHDRFETSGPGSEEYARAAHYAMGRAFYRAASRLCGFYPPWGVLTGIRPVKLLRETLAGVGSMEQAEKIFTDQYLVTRDRFELLKQTAEAEERIVALSKAESASLYISIPFCPTRCLYCSFVSQDVDKIKRLLPDYVELLCREIEATGELMNRLGLKLETIYMGGGTPTTLSAGDLSRIFVAVQNSFNLGSLREYTVEAGRPDTITEEKLRAIKEGGAGRISINPQTLSDEVLQTIGRRHTVAEFIRAAELASAFHFDCVNMDLIAGLPGDSPEGFEKTLQGVTGLKPESVTIHSLAMKRSSRLVTSGGAAYNPQGDGVRRMLDLSSSLLIGKGYLPYYLYRQRNTLGNLENVGWSLPGREGLYNVYIMDETHTILSVGAGGVTKLRDPYSGRIERVFNFKYPYEYISRFEEILRRKNQVVKFYDECGYPRQGQN